MEQFLEKTQRWFRENVGTPTEAQLLGWKAISGGEDALISAPTGSGKTLAAFLYFLDQFARRQEAGTLENELSVLYISPLKALGNDIRENLNRPLAGLGLSECVRAAVRTGDTDAKARREMTRRPPHILITTPESLYLLLTSLSGREMLKTVRAVIVDELHAVLSTKRGTHLLLSLARLDALCGRRVQRVALSATIRPLERAKELLSGSHPCAVIAPKSEKKIEMRVESPVPDMRILPENSVWPALADQVLNALKTARTVLVFADGRASCERLAQKINERAGEILARTHHGCVSKEQRLEAEKKLKSGELRVLIATSSMELGIDVGEIDRVIQIAPPSGASALLQRAGRAGHNPGRVSEVTLLPRTASEGISCALTACAALDGEIETVRAPEMCLDLLSQHLVSMAAVGDYTVNEAVDILSKATPYRELTRETVDEVLKMLSGDYERLEDASVHPRLIYDRIHGRVSGDAYTRMLALSSGGTIPDRGWYAVTLPDGTHLGELDEEYVFEARLGDRFLLGAFAWRITEITHDRVIVAACSPEGASSPFWRGDRALRAFETGLYIGKHLSALDAAARLSKEFDRAPADFFAEKRPSALDNAAKVLDESICLSGTGPRSKHDALIHALTNRHLSEDAAHNAARVLREQMRATGCLPSDRVIILEHFTNESGENQLMVHSVFGGRVNRALSILLTQAASRKTGADVRSYDDDDGILLYLLGGEKLPFGLMQTLNPKTAEAEVRASLPASPMFSMAFRYNTARALLMGVRSGRRQPLWIQRLRGAESLSRAARFPDHPMVKETLNECAETLLDLPALVQLLTRIQTGQVQIVEIETDKPSPMSLNLRRQVEAELMYESVIPSSALNLASPAKAAIKPAPEAVRDASAIKNAPINIEETHTFLLNAGDYPADDTSVPFEFLDALAETERAACIEPGLWIARENEELYRRALSENDDSAFQTVVRKCARFFGPQNAESVSARYAVSVERARNTLERLSKDGALVELDGVYLHKDVYEIAQRRTVALRRNAVKTASSEVYAAMLAQYTRFSGSVEDQIFHALQSLSGEAFPIEAWESWLLPARVQGYRPAKLDAVLSRGEAVYRLLPDHSTLLFSMPEDETAAEPDTAQTDVPASRAQTSNLPLNESEIAVYRALKARGASFARSLSSVAGPGGSGHALNALLKRGLVRADSFAPVRALAESASSSLRTAIRRRVGRWVCVPPMIEPTVEEKLNRLFERSGIVCRETAGGEWSAYLEILRRMEYAGQVRRGYFVNGMSGAQFVREEDYARVSAALAAPSDEFICLCAADPNQAWGAYLKHLPGREFTRLASSVVVLRAGIPVCVFEKQGETLRVWEPDVLPEALLAFRNAFEAGSVFPKVRRITVKRCDASFCPALENAGFVREMLDWVLLRER